MYLSLRPFDRSADLPRLPEPGRSRPRRNPVVVSIAPVEMPHLSQRFPIGFRRDGERWDLAAITGLTPFHSYHVDGQAPDGALVAPLLLRAFPLTVIDDGSDTCPVLVDETALLIAAPQRTALEQQELESRFDLTYRSLWAFLQSRRVLQPICNDLAAAGALVPWDLSFEKKSQTFGIDGLYSIDWSFMATKAHRQLVATHGWLAASIVTTHRISQHRMNAILKDMSGATGAG